jgi:2-polyprenyl-3-methyl-5-hydroxy-6-metoxy-1,4-benzoquinol methylase
MYSEYSYQTASPGCSHPYLLPILAEVCERVSPDARVADLGCGNGSLLAKICKPRWSAVGVDLSTSGISEARRSFPGIQFLNHGFDENLVEVIGPKTLDLVISTEVIEHLYAPRALARCAFELLRPGGQFVVTTPYHGYAKNCALALAGRLDSHFTALWDCGHIKFWSYRTQTTLLKEAGFCDFQFRGAGRFPFFWKSMVVSCVRPS